eukprot:gene27583-36384_t
MAPKGKNMQVFIRIRPPPVINAANVEDKLIPPKYFKLKGGDNDKSTTNIAVEFVNNSVKTTNPVEFNRMRDKTYDFDRVFGPQSSQQEIYDSVSDMVHEAIEGHSVTILTYGASSAGKSFTMHGTKTAPGILPLAIVDLFKKRDAALEADPDLFFHIDISYVELYNSNFRNLLKISAPTAKVLARRGVNSPLDVSHDNLTELESVDVSSPTGDSKGIHTSPLTSTGPEKIDIHECAFIGTFLAGNNIRNSVENCEEAMSLFNRGERLRTATTAKSDIDGTYMASRSHSIFTVYFETRKFNSVVDSDSLLNSDKLSSELRLGKINFVDLAGMERQMSQHHRADVSATSTAAAKEMHHIHLSLNALGTALSCMARIPKSAAAKAVTINPTGRRASVSNYGAIPYRDSKLTHYLKECFGGNALTVFIANIHCTADLYQLTSTTLEYATWAMRGQNRSEKRIINTLQNKAWLQVEDPETLKMRMAIEQRSKDFNKFRMLQLKSKTQNQSTDSTAEETISVSASIMVENSNDSYDDRPASILADEVGSIISTVKEEEEEVVAITTVELEPIFICPKCATVSEVEAQLRQQLAEALAANVAKSQELSAAENKIADLLGDIAALKIAAQQKQKAFDEEKQRLEQLLVNKQKDDEIIAKLVPSKRSMRSQSSIQVLGSITTSIGSSSLAGSMDDLAAIGEEPQQQSVPIHRSSSVSSISSIGDSSSPSMRKSVFGIFAPVTNLWEDRSTVAVKSPTSSSISLPSAPEVVSQNYQEEEATIPTAAVEATEVDSTVRMYGPDSDWQPSEFLDSGPSSRGRRSCVVFDFPPNSLKEQLMKLRWNISELKKCVDARQSNPTTSTTTTNTTVTVDPKSESMETDRKVVHSVDSAKLAMK